MNDTEQNDQHGPDTVEAAVLVGFTFIVMLPVVVFDWAMDRVWFWLHGRHL